MFGAFYTCHSKIYKIVPIPLEELNFRECIALKQCFGSVPIQLNTDPDPAKNLNPDPDPSYFLKLSENNM